MFPISPEDEAYLSKSISLGEAVIVLGAGASFTSKNSSGGPVKQAAGLANVIAERAGLPYNNEDLGIVLGAVRGNILSDQIINGLYKKEYFGVTPSPELSIIFNYSWKRLYTWCIDDSIENIVGRKAQRHIVLNGMCDPVAEIDDPVYLQVVKLHGDVRHPERGFIMSDIEYASALSGNKHVWYRKAAQDYIASTPIFIGSRLKEVILSAELERAKRDASSGTGRAILITPDELTPIEASSFRAKGIVHIKATLADFGTWLTKQYPNGLTPRDVVVASNSSYRSGALDKISERDLAIAHTLYPIHVSDITARLSELTSVKKDNAARRFLNGSPPSWELAASDIPV